MDVKWFKDKQKRAGVTADDIADLMGRNRSGVSHIYSGQREMSLDWAKAFAKALDVPLNEVLERAGVDLEGSARTLQPGFSESDAVPWTTKAGSNRQTHSIAQTLGGERPGVDVWEVKSDALILAGYMPGDKILVDTHQAERCKAGDVVMAQKYNMQSGTALSLLRRYEPPVLVTATTTAADQRVEIVDGTNVLIVGKVIAAWRC